MPFSENPQYLVWILVILGLWTIPWKAMALWKSARRGQIGWFVFFILINTLGIMEIIYLKVLGKKEASNLETVRINNPRMPDAMKRRRMKKYWN